MKLHQLPLFSSLQRIFYIIGPLLIIGIAHVQGQETYLFEFHAANNTLSINNNRETTLIATLSSTSGDTLNGEQIRFIVERGSAFLSTPQDDNFEDHPDGIEAFSVGNGLYVGRLRADPDTDPITVSAQWINAPQSGNTNKTISLDIVRADEIIARVDNPVLAADGEDSATIVAYVLDDLNNPAILIEDPGVTFRILTGSGTLTPIQQDDESNIPGRYAAVYRSGEESERVVIEIAVPGVDDPIRSEITLDVGRTATLEALAFPRRVARQTGNNAEQINSATILVAARARDGDLVSELGNDLVAQLVGGPGDVTGPQEILDRNGQGIGIYQFEYLASDVAGQATIRITDRNSSGVSTDVTVDIVAGISPGIVQQIELSVILEKQPFYAVGEDRAFIFALMADENGNAIRDENNPPAFVLASGQGEVENEGVELRGLNNNGTGIYYSTYTPGQAGALAKAEVRAVSSSTRTGTIIGNAGIDLEALAGPDVIIFPPSIPARARERVIIDVYDFTNSTIDLNNNEERYRISAESGKGRIIDGIRNDGNGADLAANDHLSSAIYEIDAGTGAIEDAQFSILDQVASGFPTTVASLQIKEGVTLRGIVSPQTGNPGGLVQVIVFAEDEFGLPATDHEIRVTVVEGSARVLEGGRMIDTGGTIANFEDTYANDGVYIGAVEVATTARSAIRLRITDITPSAQPTTEITLNVG